MWTLNSPKQMLLFSSAIYVYNLYMLSRLIIYFGRSPEDIFKCLNENEHSIFNYGKKTLMSSM